MGVIPGVEWCVGHAYVVLALKHASSSLTPRIHAWYIVKHLACMHLSVGYVGGLSESCMASLVRNLCKLCNLLHNLPSVFSVHYSSLSTYNNVKVSPLH